MIQLTKLIEMAQEAALEAGKKILEIYETGDFNVEAKADNSPLTMADKLAHQTICSFLEKTDLPILSEEGREIKFAERSQWAYFWMVDPLDGTKEFIKKNGEFTVNIALIHQNKVVLGVVYAPVLQKMYYAVKGEGAFLKKDNQIIKLENPTQKNEPVRIVASRSHMNPETQAIINQYQNYELVNMGSSLKLVLVAENKADVYPRLAPTMEWDTAAAQIIVEEAGGVVLHFETKTQMLYNKENLLNPHFLVLGRGF
jgi:3'(2'), 5'-bisphosphate nucleotidase